MVSKEVVNAAKEFFLYTNPRGFSIKHKLAEKKLIELCKELKVDTNLALVGFILMDIHALKAFKENRSAEHVKMAVETSKPFLDKINLNDDEKKKILNCIEAHHGEINTICKEAEICKNADCFKFLYPAGIFETIALLGKLQKPLEDSIKYLKFKVDNKYSLVTLDICKQEAEENYKIIKAFLDKVNL